MTHVHYKFSSKRSYNTVVFDGVNITLCELKRLIMTREKLRAADCDLQITNGQTNEEYTDDDSPIAKGSSVIVRRVPSRGKSTSTSNSSGRSEIHNYNSGFFKAPVDGQKAAGVLPFFSQMTDLATAEVSEDCKIKTIMNQSCYDSSNYQKYATPLPANYMCYRCGSNDHHIRSCPVSMDKSVENVVRIKKSTGIPRSFMVKVDDPNIKGAMLTNTGDYAVPAIDAEAYAVAKKKTPAQEPQNEESTDASVPDELLCLICRDLLNDAVVIPCCGNSYCDDCIRSALLDSEDHVCPSCSQSDVSPDTLIANKFLRQAVNNFTKEQISAQSFRGTPSTSQSKDCTPRPSPAPTLPPPQSQADKSQGKRPSPTPTPPPPPQSQADKSQEKRPSPAPTPSPSPQSQTDKSQVTDTCSVLSSDSPPSSFSTSQKVMKVLDETLEKETDMKKNSSPAERPSLLVSDPSISDSTQPKTLVDTVTQVVPDNSNSGSTPQCDKTPHWERSSSVSVSEGWTGISAPPPASSSVTFSFPPSPIVTPSLIQPYLPQLPLSNYPPAFSTTTLPWTSGLSPQGAPIPAFTSSPTIKPLLSKDLMMYHMSNQERTPPRGSSYNASCHYRSKTYNTKGSHSPSRSRSRSHDRTRHYSPYSSHRSLPSRSHSSHSHDQYKSSRSPASTSSRTHSRLRSRSPATDRHKSHHHHHSSSSSGGGGGRSSRRRKEREASERSYDMYLRWKQEYTDWCEKYFHSYFSHFHQMPPPPLMPPPQPHWPGYPPYHHHHQQLQRHSPPGTDSRSDRSFTTTQSSSSYSRSDSTPTQSFSDSNSPQSDDCQEKPGKVSQTNDKVKESAKPKTDSYMSPPKKTSKHKSKDDDKRVKDLKPPEKEKERKLRDEKDQKRHKARSSERTARADADRSRQPGRSRSPDSRSDKSRKNRDEETPQNQSRVIPDEPPCSSDLFPKVLEREKPKKKAVWKPQPLTKENAWEGGVKVKPQKKINININLEGKKNEDKHNIEETNKTNEADQVDVSKSEEAITLIDLKNDSWELFPDDETVVGEDSYLWQCALTAVEGEDGPEVETSVGGMEEDVKPQEQEGILTSKRNHERLSVTLDNCSTAGQSGSVILGEEQQKTEKKVLEEKIEKRSLEKHSDNIKIPRSRRDRDESEQELPAKVSSHHRERVKARRLVEADNTDETQGDYSARLDGAVAPSTDQHINDSDFDLDRKEKKKAVRDSEGRKSDEARRHREREYYNNLSRKSSHGSSQAFTGILDEEKYKSHRKLDEGRSSEWNDKHAYSEYYYHNEVNLYWTHQVHFKTSSVGQNSSQEQDPPTAESCQGTALDPGERREGKGQESKSERKKDKKKSHKKEKRHASPDEERKARKKSKDGGQMDLSKVYLFDKHT